MHPVLKILAAIALAGAAVYFFIEQHWLTGTACLAGALAIVLPKLVGEELGDIGDAELMVRFVRNPFDTVVDEVVDRIGPNDDPEPEGRASDRPAPAYYPPKDPAPTFDPDAAIARYMAQRGTVQDELGAAASQVAPVRTFGRKQV